MSKVRKQGLLLLVLAVIGVALMTSGIVMKTRAAVIGEPGQELDLVYNLYRRSLTSHNGGQSWDVGGFEQLGRYFGGYVIGLQYCNTYNFQSLPDIGKNAFVCDDSSLVSATGFGILYQRPTDDAQHPTCGGKQNCIHILIQLPCYYLDGGSVENKTCPNLGGEYSWIQGNDTTILPWFDYSLEENAVPAGHVFTSNGPVGGETYHGYVSLEIRTDLDNLD